MFNIFVSLPEREPHGIMKTAAIPEDIAAAFVMLL